MCCGEKRHESDSVPPSGNSVWKGAKAEYGEGPKINLKKDFVKEMVLALCLVGYVGFLPIDRTQKGGSQGELGVSGMFKVDLGSGRMLWSQG